MVTVLILIVVVKATKVVLFPKSLYVSVLHGSIWFSSNSSDPPTLLFDINLRIDNPRKRVNMYYVDVVAFLFDNDTPASSTHPSSDSFVYFSQRDKLMGPQQSAIFSLLLIAQPITIEPRFFNLLYNNESASMSGVTMRMDATLLTEDMTSGGYYNTSRPVTYYCWPLVILHHKNFPDDPLVLENFVQKDNVFCRDAQESHFI
ncbi:unnamed protein product [Miscanthus lutarioriparius]|uniref:Late embryogenesis abundant protein LEA-2 subgroup domain-containing protein n=1 Tax=Miscanthus lutarioriparius TaxID=422564 RepID=A0A811SBL6_9POAL|nr:unnamed protein product [Miscanthus lutarioriparius]